LNTASPCTGSHYTWGIENPSVTYPFSAHHPSSRFLPGYQILQVDDSNSTIHVRGPHCSSIASNVSEPCAPCQSLAERVKRVELHAKSTTFQGVLNVSLSHAQMSKKLLELEKKIVRLRGKVRLSYFLFTMNPNANQFLLVS
jgi:hypothetical protein